MLKAYYGCLVHSILMKHKKKLKCSGKAFYCPCDPLPLMVRCFKYTLHLSFSGSHNCVLSVVSNIRKIFFLLFTTLWYLNVSFDSSVVIIFFLYFPKLPLVFSWVFMHFKEATFALIKGSTDNTCFSIAHVTLFRIF